MPIHDWTRVEAGIFHDFRHAWIEEIKRALNGALQSLDHYALAERHAGPSSARLTNEIDLEFYRRKQSTVVVRHATGDRIVAMVEVVSPGNKASRNAMRAFIEKASQLLDKRIHLLILDLNPPGPRDRQGSTRGHLGRDDRRRVHGANRQAAHSRCVRIRADGSRVRCTDRNWRSTTCDAALFGAGRARGNASRSDLCSGVRGRAAALAARSGRIKLWTRR